MAVPTKKCKPEYDNTEKKKKYYFNVRFSTDQLKSLLLTSLALPLPHPNLIHDEVIAIASSQTDLMQYNIVKDDEEKALKQKCITYWKHYKRIKPIVDTIIITYQTASELTCADLMMKLLTTGCNCHLSSEEPLPMDECVEKTSCKSVEKTSCKSRINLENFDVTQIAKLSDSFLKCRLKRYKTELENLRNLPITPDTTTHVSKEMNKHKEYIKLLEEENTRRLNNL